MTGFPSPTAGCTASLLPGDLSLLGLFTVGVSFVFQGRVEDRDGLAVWLRQISSLL